MNKGWLSLKDWNKGSHIGEIGRNDITRDRFCRSAFQFFSDGIVVKIDPIKMESIWENRVRIVLLFHKKLGTPHSF